MAGNGATSWRRGGSRRAGGQGNGGEGGNGWQCAAGESEEALVDSMGTGGTRARRRTKRNQSWARGLLQMGLVLVAMLSSVLAREGRGEPEEAKTPCQSLGWHSPPYPP
eukprot:287861-Rhodomonas_salina.1